MKKLLQSARNEIMTLRRRNEVLEAQIGIVEAFAAALGLKRACGAMHPDVVYEIDKQIQAITEDCQK